MLIRCSTSTTTSDRCRLAIQVSGTWFSPSLQTTPSTPDLTWSAHNFTTIKPNSTSIAKIPITTTSNLPSWSRTRSLTQLKAWQRHTRVFRIRSHRTRSKQILLISCRRIPRLSSVRWRWSLLRRINHSQNSWSTCVPSWEESSLSLE